MKKCFPVIKALLIFVIIITSTALIPGDVGAQQSTILTLDVWTNKGGQGEGVAGGSFQVGEPLILYAKASISCQGKLTWMGPSGTGLRQLNMQAGEIVNIPLSFPDASAIGLWQVKFEAQYENQYKTDLTSLFITDKNTPPSPPSTPVTPAPAPAPAPAPPPAQSQPATSPPQQSAAKIGPGSATELQALMAQKITEGLLTGDPRMDVNEDGKITSEDVLLILLWSVDKNTGQTPTPAGEEKTQQPLSPPSNVTPPASSTPSATTSPATKTTPSTTPVTTPATTGSDLLAGKWQMSRLQINSPIPEEVPDVVINMTFPEKPTWEINRSRGQLQIKYDGKNTWYKKTFLGNGISESATSVQESKDGLSCTFLTPAKFYFGSLPFPIGLIFRDITRIQGSFSSTVDVVVSGNNLKATASIGKISGTFQKKHKDGRQTTESINFSAIKVLYQGTKK